MDTPFFGQILQRMAGSGVDMETLEKIATVTGGFARAAEDEEGLRRIYEEIDRLERSEIESFRYLDYRELFVPVALAGMILLGLEVLLNCTVFRKTP